MSYFSENTSKKLQVFGLGLVVVVLCVGAFIAHKLYYFN